MKTTATPTPRILLSTRNRKWTVGGAIAELIDNSFGQERGAARNVWIYWDPSRRVLGIRDDGRGMDSVNDLFILGKGAVSGGRDTGRYGVGGSEALLWLSDIATVNTLRNGQTASTSANWAKCISNGEFPEVDDTWRPSDAANTESWLFEIEHGTLVAMLLRDGVRINVQPLQNQLGRLFGVGLRSGLRITWIEGGQETQLHAWSPGKLSDVIDAKIEVRPGLTAHVHAGRAEDISVAQSKLSVNYVYRQIEETTDGFGRSLQGAVGYIDLGPGWLEHLTTTKDGFVDEEARGELMAKVREVLAPLIEQLEQKHLERVFDNVKIGLERKIKNALQQAEGRGKSDSTAPRQPVKNPRGPNDKPPSTGSVAVIRIEPSTLDKISGKLCDVGLPGPLETGGEAVAYVAVDHDLVREALKKEPINKRLLESVLISHLAPELLERNALVRTGLYSEESYAELTEANGNNDLKMLPHVIRRLTDGVRDE